jgi:replicative DNA helicase
MGKRTGWQFLDKYIGGYNEGELIIIAGRPGMGKTAFAMSLGIDFAKLGNHVLFFSLEMSIPQLAKRIISHEADVPNYKVRNGQLSHRDIEEVLDFYNNRLDFDFHIDDTAGISIETIRAKAADHKNRHGLDLLIVDYIQLIQGVGQNREQEIASISRGLKLISKESKCTVMGLAQLSRAVEHRQDKRPFMSDLRESGAIEQDADVVMFPYRPAYYEQGPKRPMEDDAEIIIGKNRNGETCYINVAFIGEQTKYKEI